DPHAPRPPRPPPGERRAPGPPPRDDLLPHPRGSAGGRRDVRPHRALPAGRTPGRGGGRLRADAFRGPSAGSARRWAAVLFDLDGTLADTVPLILDCYRHTMRTHLGEAPPDARWLRTIGT